MIADNDSGWGFRRAQSTPNVVAVIETLLMQRVERVIFRLYINQCSCTKINSWTDEQLNSCTDRINRNAFFFTTTAEKKDSLTEL